MGFRDLRVINEDRVDPGHGFPPHDHKDMEILSIVLEGNLSHQDSMGTESVISANEVQGMSAGTGVTHSEYNASEEPVHFLQIWIIPDKDGITPRYQLTELPSVHNHWTVIASKSGKDDSIKIQQDVELSAIKLDPGKHVEKKVSATRYGWIQVIDGKIEMNNEVLQTGDGVAIDPNTHIKLMALSASRLLYFDLK